MATAKLSFSGKLESYIIERVTDVIKKLTGNLFFATPEPSLIIVQEKLDKLIADTAAAAKGGSDRIFVRGLSRKDMIGTMISLVGYVQHASGGDELMILSAGMDVDVPHIPFGLLSPPSNVRSKFGAHKGEIQLNWGGVKHKKVYIVQINDTPGDDSKWINLAISSQNKFLVTGLISLKEYAFRIASFNAAGISAWSDLTQHAAL